MVWPLDHHRKALSKVTGKRPFGKLFVAPAGLLTARKIPINRGKHVADLQRQVHGIYRSEQRNRDARVREEYVSPEEARPQNLNSSYRRFYWDGSGGGGTAV